jgi:hypothetical protein
MMSVFVNVCAYPLQKNLDFRDKSLLQYFKGDINNENYLKDVQLWEAGQIVK